MARIVLIDDDPFVRGILGEMLSFMGHEVQLAREGYEGTRMVKDWSADLVITDILMDGLEGIETLRQLKTDRPDLPVIMISGGGAMPSDTLLKFGNKFGADMTLRKPIKVDDLKSATENVLAASYAA